MHQYVIKQPFEYDAQGRLIVEVGNNGGNLKHHDMLWRRIPDEGIEFITPGDPCPMGKICIEGNQTDFHYLTLVYKYDGSGSHPDPHVYPDTQYDKDSPQKYLWVITASIDSTGKTTARKARKTKVKVRHGGG